MMPMTALMVPISPESLPPNTSQQMPNISDSLKNSLESVSTSCTLELMASTLPAQLLQMMLDWGSQTCRMLTGWNRPSLWHMDTQVSTRNTSTSSSMNCRCERWIMPRKSLYEDIARLQYQYSAAISTSKQCRVIKVLLFRRMFLTHKQTTLKLPSADLRVKKLILVSSSTAVVATSQALFMYDLLTGQMLFMSTLDDWRQENPQITHDPMSIIDMAFNKQCRRVFLVLSRNQYQKQQTCLLLGLSAEEAKFASPRLLCDTDKCRTKYENMELRPKVLGMPGSDYTLFVREFYNDSLLVVYRGESQEREFFLNQENLSCFDQQHEVVSFRAEFKAEFNFEVFDIRGLSSRKYTILLSEAGVVQAVKKISPQSTVKQSSNSSLYLPQNAEAEGVEAVLAVNWRHQKAGFIRYNVQKSQVINRTLENTLFLRFLSFNAPYSCSLQLKNNSTQITYQRVSGPTTQPCSVGSNYEEWEVYEDSRREEFVVVNYSQQMQNEGQIGCALYRSVGRLECVLALAERLGIHEDTVRIVVDMLAL